MPPVAERAAVAGRRATVQANFLWLLTERGWRAVIGVLVSVLVTRYLGPADVGRLSFAASLCAILAAVAGFGLEDVLARELIRQPNAARSLLRLAIRIKIAGAAGAYVIAVVGAVFWQAGDPQTVVLVAWSALAFWFSPADLVELWHQSQERMKRPALVRQLALLMGAGVRLGLVGAGAPVWCFAAAAALETALIAAGFGWLWWRGGGRELTAGAHAPTRYTAAQLLRESAPLLFSGLLVLVTMHCDRLLLIRLAGEAPAGVYAAAARLTELLYILPVALGAALLPRLATLHAADPVAYWRTARQAGLAALSLTGVVAGAVTALAPWGIPWLLGEAFRPSAAVWQVHIWTLPLVALVSVRSRLWVVENRSAWVLAISAVTAGLNVAGNAWLIPRHGAIGAAWSGVAAWSLSALVWPWLAAGPRAFMRRWCGLAKGPDI